MRTVGNEQDSFDNISFQKDRVVSPVEDPENWDDDNPNLQDAP